MFLHGKGLKPGSEDDGERRPTTEGDKLREQKVSPASRTALLPPPPFLEPLKPSFRVVPHFFGSFFPARARLLKR